MARKRALHPTDLAEMGLANERPVPRVRSARRVSQLHHALPTSRAPMRATTPKSSLLFASCSSFLSRRIYILLHASSQDTWCELPSPAAKPRCTCRAAVRWVHLKSFGHVERLITIASDTKREQAAL